MIFELPPVGWGRRRPVALPPGKQGRSSVSGPAASSRGAETLFIPPARAADDCFAGLPYPGIPLEGALFEERTPHPKVRFRCGTQVALEVDNHKPNSIQVLVDPSSARHPSLRPVR